MTAVVIAKKRFVMIRAEGKDFDGEGLARERMRVEQGITRIRPDKGRRFGRNEDEDEKCRSACACNRMHQPSSMMDEGETKEGPGRGPRGPDKSEEGACAGQPKDNN